MKIGREEGIHSLFNILFINIKKLNILNLYHYIYCINFLFES